MIGTSAHRVLNAYRFVQANTIWGVVGGQTAWTDDQAPPLPEITTSSINTIIGAKKATVSLVVRDDLNGDQTFLSSGVVTRWRIVTDLAQAITDGARTVLIKAIIIGDELPLQTFREIGFYSGLEVKAAVAPGKEALIPAEIEGFGKLEFIEYRKPVTRELTSAYEVAALIDF